MITEIEKLKARAPKALFTKSEAVKISNKILDLMIEVEPDENRKNILEKICIKIEMFDEPDSYVDLLLDDVSFIDWEYIENVISSEYEILS